MPSLVFTPILDTFTDVIKTVTFLQIGANDGVWNDPIEPYVRGGKWHGMMVEPVPYIFERLQARYGLRQDLILENCAIAAADGEQTFYSVLQTEHDETVFASAIGSFSLAHVLKHAPRVPQIGKRIQTIQVKCLTVQTLLTKHKVTNLDALVIDAEGFDGDIVQSIEYDHLRPTLIFYEHKHLKPTLRAECFTLLKHNGYQLLEGQGNTLALQSAFCVSHRELTQAWQEATALEAEHSKQ